MTRHLWTIANAVMLVAFVFSLIIQFNDPDPYTWALIYGAAALVCAFEVRRLVHPLVATGVSVVAVAWAATLAPRVVGKVRFSAMFAEFEMANIGVEESREMYGLVSLPCGCPPSPSRPGDEGWSRATERGRVRRGSVPGRYSSPATLLAAHECACVSLRVQAVPEYDGRVLVVRRRSECPGVRGRTHALSAETGLSRQRVKCLHSQSDQSAPPDLPRTAS